MKNKPSDSVAIGMPERRVREFLAAENPSAPNLFEHSVWRSERIGKSSWMVFHGIEGLPMGPERFLVDREGTVHRIAAEPLSDIRREEFRPHVTDPDHEKFITGFLKMLSNEHFIRLQSVDDIPGYRRRPLLAEREAKIQPPHRTPEGNQVFFTTWRSILQPAGAVAGREDLSRLKPVPGLRVARPGLSCLAPSGQQTESSDLWVRGRTRPEEDFDSASFVGKAETSLRSPRR